MNRGNGRRRRRRGGRGRPPNSPEWVGGPLNLPQCPFSPPTATTTTNNHSATSNASLSECQPPPAGPLHLQPITRFCRVQDTHSSSTAPSTHSFMDLRTLAQIQRLLQDAPPSQREKLFWDVYTQLAEYFGQPHAPLQSPNNRRSLTRLSPSPWNQVTLCNRTLNNRYKEEFEEVTVLGDGGFGHVVKARNRLDGCFYAIKIIDVEDKGNVSPDQSLQEVRALAKLNSPRVVRYHNAWLQCDLRAWSSVGSSSRGTASGSEEEEEDEEDAINRTSRDRSDGVNGVVPGLPSHHQGSTDDSVVFQFSGNRGGSPMALQPYRPPQAVQRPRRTLYIQMGLCGESLKEWLDQRNMNAEPVVKDRCMVIFRELTEALSYIHDLGLIHRDVKPANIFFTLEGHHHHIQLGDFGLAKQNVQVPMSRPGAASDLVPVLAQRNTSRVGTKLYTAPEVDRGSNYGQKSDIFSAGITLLELLSSFSTFHQRVQDIKHLREERRLDPELIHKWPEIAHLILKLTDPEPANRPSSAELLTSLLCDPFPPPLSPANTTITTIAPTAVPPDPGLANRVLTVGETIGNIKTYNLEVNCIESASRPPSEEPLTSPLFNPFPAPPSPAITTGTTIASTTVPPDPGLSNGVLAMGDAIGSVETYSSEVNHVGTLNMSPVMRSLEVSHVTESSSVINTIQRQVSEAEENVILREENSRLKRKVEELERKLQHLSVAECAPPTLKK